MRKLFLVLAAAATMAVAGASWSDGNAKAADWSSSATPVKVKPGDNCAKVGKSRVGGHRGALAFRPFCGGGWPVVTQCWSHFAGSYWEGFYGYDGGPSASPRYYTSWWTASYNLCG
jgi:hypothetical protein